MRKILIIAIIGLFTTNLSAINDTTLKVPPDSLQLTYKEVYKDIKSGISAIADGLKVGSEHVYGILVKQQLVNSIIYIVILILSLIILIWCIKIQPKLGWRGDSYYESEWKDKGGYEGFKKRQFSFLNIISIILTIGSIISLTITLCNLDIIIMGILNPEYGAIHEILTIIK